MQTKIKEINLLNDVMFKCLMTNENNREMVVDFIHALTKIDKEKLKNATYIGGEEILKKKIKEKKQITDVTIRISDKQKIIIEMNQYKIANIFEKNSLYAFSRIVESTKKNIRKYPKIILINIDNFNKYKTEKPIIEFKMRDLEGNIETELYNSIHLVLANVTKNKYNVDKEIKKFVSFLKMKDIEELEESYEGDEKYMAAIRTVEELSRDPEFEGYYDYEEAKKQELEDAKIYAMEEGREQGREQGIEQGEKRKAVEIAKKMFAKGTKFNEIQEITGITREEIENLKC